MGQYEAGQPTSYFFYDDITRKITMTGVCLERDIELQTPPDGQSRGIGEANWETDYYPDNDVIRRPDMAIALSATEISADGVDEVVLTGLPDPCYVVFSGPGFLMSDDVSGGSLALTTDVTGTHSVKVSSWPYFDAEVSFEAI